MIAVAARLDALEGLARRTICPAPASASASISYAAGMAILGEIFTYFSGLESGRGDAAAMRLGPHDLIQLRSRRMPLVEAIEIIAGFGASAERDQRRAALTRFEAQIEVIRGDLGISASA